MPRKKTNRRLVSYIFLLINVVCWGAALIIVKPVFAVTTPFRFLLYRYFFACFFSLPFLFYFLPRIKNKRKKIGTIIKIDLLGTTVALSLLYFGLAKTSAIEASLLTTTTPIFTVLAGVLLLREKEEKHEWLGLAIAFLGTLLLTLVPFLNGHFVNKQLSFMGNLMIIGQNITNAIYFIIAKKHYRKIPKLFATTISFYVGLVSFFLLALSELSFSINDLLATITADFSHTSVWIASLYMAIFGSIIGLTAYIKGQDGIEASEATLFSYLQPLIYLPLGILWLKESIGVMQIVSLLIILTGVVMVERRVKKQSN